MKRLHTQSIAAFIAGILLLGACNLFNDFSDNSSRWQVRPGAIVFYGDTSAVGLAADTVQAGVPLRVSATTFGGGCTRPAGMNVEVHGLEAVVMPLDSVYTPGPNEACTMELNEFDHSAEVIFEQAGEGRIVVQGVKRGPDVDESGEVVRLARTVVVVE